MYGAPKVTHHIQQLQHYLRTSDRPVRRLPTSRPARSLVAEAPPEKEMRLVLFESQDLTSLWPVSESLPNPLTNALLGDGKKKQRNRTFGHKCFHELNGWDMSQKNLLSDRNLSGCVFFSCGEFRRRRRDTGIHQSPRCPMSQCHHLI